MIENRGKEDEGRYNEISQLYPQVEHHQTVNHQNLCFGWSLNDFPVLEKLDLDGFNVRIAFDVPTIRVLNIQQSHMLGRWFPESD